MFDWLKLKNNWEFTVLEKNNPQRTFFTLSAIFYFLSFPPFFKGLLIKSS